MKRKVIKQGNGTLTITLPKKWTKNVGLEGGYEIEVEERGKSLVIASDKQFSLEKAELDGADLDLILLKRYINTLYKMGTDEIKLVFDKPEIIENIQEILQKNLVGYEIIEQGKSFCTIKSVSTVIDSEFDATLRRIFLLLSSMAKESLDAIRVGDMKHLKSVGLLEENNNRFTTLCRRMLNKRGYKDFRKTTFIYHIVEQLEKIADEYRYLIEFFYESKNIKGVSKEVLNLFEDVNRFIEKYYELFYKYKKGKAIEFSEDKKIILKKAYNLFKTKSYNERIIVHHLIIITRNMFDLLAPYLALVL